MMSRDAAVSAKPVLCQEEIRAEIARFDEDVAQAFSSASVNSLSSLAGELAVYEAMRALRETGVKRLGWISSGFRINLVAAAALHHGITDLVFISDERGRMPLLLPGQGMVQAHGVAEIPSLGLDALLCLREFSPTATQNAFDAARDSIPCPVADIDVAAAYERLCGEEALRIASQINALDVDVLYVAEFAYFNLCRQSQALRDRGLRTAILVQHPQSMEGKDIWFDGVFCSYRGPGMFFNILRNTKAPLLHVQGWLTLHHLGVMVRAARPEARLVVEFNDIPSLVGDGDFLDLAFGPQVANMERHCEPLLHQLADGLVFNVSKPCADALGERFHTRGERLVFHSYPTRALCHDAPAPAPIPEGRAHLLFMGSLPPSSHPRELYGDVQILPMIRQLIARGIRFDIMLPPGHYRSNPNYADYRFLHDEDVGFRFVDGVFPEALSKTIAGYDYGVMFYPLRPSLRMGKAHFDCMMPSKFYSFLEGGLPILVSEEFRYVSSLVTRHGLGLAVSQADIPRLDEVLAGVDPAEFRRNIAAYRKTIHMDDMIGEMLAFYGRLRGGRWSPRVAG